MIAFVSSAGVPSSRTIVKPIRKPAILSTVIEVDPASTVELNAVSPCAKGTGARVEVVVSRGQPWSLVVKVVEVVVRNGQPCSLVVKVVEVVVRNGQPCSLVVKLEVVVVPEVAVNVLTLV
jgi:hypothetical protein